MAKVTIEIDVPEQYVEHLESEVRNAVRAVRNRYICLSTYGDDSCVLGVGHDGPTCTNEVREWPNPFASDSPAPGQRVFETGRKACNRITGTVYEMGSVANGNVQLIDGPSSVYEEIGQSFWAKYYAIPRRPADTSLTAFSVVGEVMT